MPALLILCAILLALAAPPASAQVALYLSGWSCDTRAGAVDVAPDGSLWVAVPGALRRYSPDGALLQTVGAGWFGGSPGSECPGGAVFDPAGRGYLADALSARVHVFLPTGECLATWATGGAAATAIAMDGEQRLYVADRAAGALRVHSTAGALLATWPMPTPVAVDVDATARALYVAVLDPGGQGAIRKYDLEGRHLGTFGSFNSPHDIAVSTSHEVFVTERGVGRVSAFTGDGRFIGFLGSPRNAADEAGDTIGVACAADGSIYISHLGRGTIQRFARVDVTATSRQPWGALKARYR